ncbi:DUF2065 domain-containing protein [Ferrimonas futtsuensis]|uniref:DUF2065 domain-containing protein n=1 Tax=Ferrimonas futtsuensis TaxID=364764 RepID=UPI000413A109|nr:DUF2065 family protein [Ferrimonas futtsuensis]
MSDSWLLALGLLLLMEGIGPAFLPRQWRAAVSEMSRQPDAMLRRIGGALVTAGAVILYIFS